MKSFTKNILTIFSLTYILLFASSCQKEENVLGVGYGELNLSGEFAAGAEPLLVLVDGDVKDTLRVDKPRTLKNIILKSGQYKVSLVTETTKSIVSETSVNIETVKIFQMPTFLFTGAAVLFDDDSDLKPEQDSILVRFVTLDPTLPDQMDIEIVLYYNSGGAQVLSTGKKLVGVSKSGFSEYLQLQNPTLLAPPDARSIRYIIEGYDSDTKEKVMSYDQRTMGLFPTVHPNGDGSLAGPIKMSVGIDVNNGSNEQHQTKVVFWKDIE